MGHPTSMYYKQATNTSDTKYCSIGRPIHWQSLATAPGDLEGYGPLQKIRVIFCNPIKKVIVPSTAVFIDGIYARCVGRDPGDLPRKMFDI